MKRFLMMPYLAIGAGIAWDTAGGAGGGGAGGGGAGGAPEGDDAAAAAAAAAGAAGDAAGAGDGGAGAGKPGDADPYSWFGDGLDDDAKAYMESKSFKKPADLYKSLRGAEKLIRGDQIAGPPEDAEKHADWMKESGLAKRLGIPEAPDGYDVAPPEFDDAVKAMVQYDDVRHARLLETAHKLNMTPAQVSGLVEFYAAEIGSDAQAFLTEVQADEEAMTTTLKKDWGESYDQNLTAALEVAKEVGLDEGAVESLRQAKVIGSAQLTKILHELAVSRGNDTLKGGGKGGSAPQTKETAQAALDTFMGKNAAALTRHDHPEHESAMRRLQDLKRAAGRGSVAS